jgi:tetratricopeptide (TPR) repeat protein
MGVSRRYWLIAFVAVWALGCGGGNGLGPKDLQQQETKLRDRLPLDWDLYNAGSYTDAIAAFTATLTKAEALQDQPEVQREVKSEAYDGIGWTYFRQQDLASAADAFRRSTTLNGQNTDAWVGWAGVSLAQRQYNDVVQYCLQALDRDTQYNSAYRTDTSERRLAHDGVDSRHVRVMLAQAYVQLGRYSATEKADPGNAAAQLRILRSDYRYVDPGQLIRALSDMALSLTGQ